MTAKSIVLASACCSCLVAGDYEVALRLTEFRNRSFSMDTAWGTQLSGDPENSHAAGLQFGYEMAKVGEAALQAQVVVIGRSSIWFERSERRPYYFSDSSRQRFFYEGAGARVQAVWGKAVEFGLGAELRYEHFSLDSEWPSNTGMFRPWIHARSGYVFRGKPVQPFLGIELGVPVTHRTSIRRFTDPTGLFLGSDPGDLMKSMAPKFEWTLFLGIRK